MALVGAGMLCTLMDIDPIDEAEFNRWYDKEHMEERASIPGFLNCRRYVALEGRPKYLNLYDTESLEALNAPIYQKALQNQTDWSKRMLARFKNFHRKHRGPHRPQCRRRAWRRRRLRLDPSGQGSRGRSQGMVPDAGACRAGGHRRCPIRPSSRKRSRAFRTSARGRAIDGRAAGR